jgi:SpoVK/Ycf46/Vps4 family AAA+-type ATPase
VILSGDKGIGKSLFARLLGRKAVENGIPVLIVDKYIENIGTFIDEIDQEIMVLFDEFDKTFSKGMRDEDPQVTMLSLFDGVSPRKKLFVVTCNELRGLNGFMVNRPGRFHYHLRFDYPGAKDIREYLEDALMDEYKGEIDSVIEFSNRVGLNYDCLRSIAFELNQGLSFAEAIKDINIVNVEREPYNLKILFEDGTIYLNNKFYMDSFSEDEIEVELHEKHGSYAGDITFLPYKLQFDSRSGDLFIDAADAMLDYVTYDDEDKEKKKALMSKPIQKIIIHRVFDNRLHYAV